MTDLGSDVRARTAHASAGRVGAAGSVVDVLVLVGALALALSPLVPVFGVAPAWRTITVGLVLGTAVAAAGALRRWSGIGVVAVVVLVYFGVGGAVAAARTTSHLVLPTGATLTGLASGAVTSWKQVLTLDPPLGDAGTLLVAPFLLALCGATLALSIVWRARSRGARAAAALVPPVVLVVAILLGTTTVVVPLAVGLALSAGLVTWAAWRSGGLQPRRVLSLVLVLGVAGVSGAALGPAVTQGTTRHVLRDEITPPFDPRAFTSPLSAFRRFVKEQKDTDLLTVTGLPKGATIRLATLDAFDGVVWNVAGGGASGSGEFRRVGSTIEESVPGERVAVGVQIRALSGVWLPTVGDATGFRFTGTDAGTATEHLRYNDATGAAVLTGGLSDTVSYTVDAVLPPVPDDTEIGSAPAADVVLPPTVDVPDVVGVRAAEIARTAGAPVLVARSLQKALADEGYFSNGQTDVGEYPSLAGHGANRVATLLGGALMVGDGEQYASAMALMARQMGLPARVVLGFVPSGPQVGASSITFTGAQIQAWVEIAFAGHGWVPFFPTPPESRTPQKDNQPQQPQADPQVLQPPPPPPAPVSAPHENTEQPQTDDPRRDGQGTSVWHTVAVVGAVAAIPLGLLVLPVALVLGLKRRRRRRRLEATDPVLRVVGGWSEALDAARDHGRPPPRLATRREIARALGGDGAVTAPTASSVRGKTAAPAGPGGWTSLADRTDEAVFGVRPPDDDAVEKYWADVRATVASLGQGMSRWRRLRAQLSVASLRRGR